MNSIYGWSKLRGLLRKCLRGNRQILSRNSSLQEDDLPSEISNDHLTAEEIQERFFSPLLSSDADSNSLMLQQPDQPLNPKILKVSVLGMPNAGKSTLINSFVGRNILATSSRINTTTQNILAVKTVGDTQVIFQDTPGMMNKDKAKRHNASSAVSLPGESFFESDLGLIVGDLTSRRLKDGYLHPEILLTMIKNRHIPTVLVLNKVDKYKKKDHLLILIHLLTGGQVSGIPYEPQKQKLVPLRLPKVRENILTEYKTLDLKDEGSLKAWMGNNEMKFLNKLRHCRGWPHFKDVFVISSKEGRGVEKLKNYMLSYAKPGPWKYHSAVQTDASPTQIVLDLVRASLLELLPDEIPYKVAPRIADWQETADGRLIVDIDVVCGTRSHYNVTARKCFRIAKETQEFVQDTFFLEAYVRVNPVFVKNLKLE